jgi:hypothetical protein
VFSAEDLTAPDCYIRTVAVVPFTLGRRYTSLNGTDELDIVVVCKCIAVLSDQISRVLDKMAGEHDFISNAIKSSFGNNVGVE